LTFATAGLRAEEVASGFAVALRPRIWLLDVTVPQPACRLDKFRQMSK
jgi:hypothetical protein